MKQFISRQIGVCPNCGKPLEGKPCDCAEVEKWFKDHRGSRIADGVYEAYTDKGNSSVNAQSVVER